jgi:hypothetical protein
MRDRVGSWGRVLKVYQIGLASQNVGDFLYGLQYSLTMLRLYLMMADFQMSFGFVGDRCKAADLTDENSICRENNKRIYCAGIVRLCSRLHRDDMLKLYLMASVRP